MELDAKIIYAVGDIHGHLDLLTAMWDRIVADVAARGLQMSDVVVVFLGDYVDRGPDSEGVIDFVIDKQKSFNVVALKGNHEDMMLAAIKFPQDRYFWEDNGGAATLRSYAGFHGPGAYSYISDTHEEWLRNLSLVFETEHHIFVHAGLLPHRALDDQFENHLMWVREPFLECADPFYTVDHTGSRINKHVVHGHTPWLYDKLKEARSNLRTNLDSGAYFTYRLTCGVFNPDHKGKPESYIEVVGDKAEQKQKQRPSGLWVIE